jgi:hypothetical protein
MKDAAKLGWLLLLFPPMGMTDDLEESELTLWKPPG